MLENQIKNVIRDIKDFPKPGIIFKDITPILKDQKLCSDIVDEFVLQIKDLEFDAIAGIESRGFLFGLMLANKLNKPFIPIRKSGKLPFKTIQQSYDLEYGSAIIEIHEDAFEPNSKILIHDDLLATGGTVEATSLLIQKMKGEIAGYSFLISLDFLNGKEKLRKFSENNFSLANYQ
ncbi:adenine phosphoribosyltransferase [Pedobacter psychrophilus]|uniref:Adenine phosphoribosyltransferase n=1 Tax=Pedobacter psychrophilus TaxID=1826909 RepID=A0A179DKK7_9SPHI|nr:adenine phosphoribosyltransferase [Pedobacter psychrophilus]OAQ41595.1 adenine phosphoribosyltransferase [Pedobacter psychrophilus]